MPKTIKKRLSETATSLVVILNNVRELVSVQNRSDAARVMKALVVYAKNNGMIDVFKSYAKSGGMGILFVDAAMMISTALLSSFLYSQPAATTIISGSIAVYSLPYILTTRNEFSTV